MGTEMSDLIQTDAALEAPVTRRDAVIEYFAAGAKPPSEWRVGTEYEKVAVDRKTGRAARYFGPRGIEAVLRRLADRFGWTPRFEGEHVIALEGRKATITLEPGGQLELSGAPFATLHETAREFREHIALVNAISERLGIV
jgi:glutamate--cysteine ligase